MFFGFGSSCLQGTFITHTKKRNLLIMGLSGSKMVVIAVFFNPLPYWQANTPHPWTLTLVWEQRTLGFLKYHAPLSTSIQLG